MGILTIEQARNAHQGATIYEGAENVINTFVIAGIGNTKNITAMKCDAGLIIGIGCMNDYHGHNVENTLVEIRKKYSKDHLYFDAIKLIEKWYAAL